MNSCGMTFRFTNMLALLAIALLAACSGSPKATQNVENLSLIAENATVAAFTPKAVLTIPPTTSEPTATRVEPTATRVKPTATSTKLADTSTPTASEIPTATATITPTDPLPKPTAGSGCPEGCLEESESCNIKGNINNEGVKIFHMPYQNFYSRTKISPEKGERWFCTPAEAEANGWRASQQ